MRRKLVVGLCIIIVTAILLPQMTGVEASEVIPYDTYTYDHYDSIRYTPAAYVPAGVIDGSNWETGRLKSPQDCYVAFDGTVYIADAGNNRIVVLDDNYNYKKEITGFIKDGTENGFNNPNGVYLSLKGNLYIADTGNMRIVELDEDGKLVQIIENPQSEVLGEGFIFAPVKVAVDYADRVYVIAKNMFQGIMAFNNNGDFTGFKGTVDVEISLSERFWRRFSTKEQRSKQKLFIPTEFTGMDIDDGGFIYTTNVDSTGEKSVRRLNPKGEDVIRSNGKDSSGDRMFLARGDYSGASRIVDIIVRERGGYSILDSTRGRVFTYDQEGSLLYIFGGIGSQEGTFQTPVAIESKGEEILVLDSGKEALIRFSPTEYGKLIHIAIGLRNDGNEEAAVECFKQILRLDANLELAYDEIGKSYLAAGENKIAMEYFVKAKDQAYYSIAFRRYRNEMLKSNMYYILGILLVVIVFRRIISRKKRLFKTA